MNVSLVYVITENFKFSLRMKACVKSGTTPRKVHK